jgi:hypothetical protein
MYSIILKSILWSRGVRTVINVNTIKLEIEYDLPRESSLLTLRKFILIIDSTLMVAITVLVCPLCPLNMDVLTRLINPHVVPNMKKCCPHRLFQALHPAVQCFCLSVCCVPECCMSEFDRVWPWLRLGTGRNICILTFSYCLLSSPFLHRFKVYS